MLRNIVEKNKKLETKDSMLRKAAANNNYPLIKKLINEKADVNLGGCSAKKLPLHLAVEINNIEMVSLLIEAKSNVDARTLNGTATLHIAARHGYKNILLQLIRAGANLNLGTNAGCTPLHEAAANGKDQVTRILIKHKADPTIRDTCQHLTPGNYAHRNGHLDISKFLTNAINYQQNFIQNIIYFLSEWKRISASDSTQNLACAFIDKALTVLVPIKNSDELFMKLSAILKSSEYSEVKESLKLLRKSLTLLMKKYNYDKTTALAKTDTTNEEIIENKSDQSSKEQVENDSTLTAAPATLKNT